MVEMSKKWVKMGENGHTRGFQTLPTAPQAGIIAVNNCAWLVREMQVRWWGSAVPIVYTLG